MFPLSIDCPALPCADATGYTPSIRHETIDATPGDQLTPPKAYSLKRPWPYALEMIRSAWIERERQTALAVVTDDLLEANPLLPGQISVVAWPPQGLTILSPAASKGLVSLVAIMKPRAAAVAAM